MKHLKTITAILIAALTLTGCSKNETSTTNSDGASSAQSAVSDNSIGTSGTSSTNDTNSSTENTAESSSAPESKTESSPTSTSSALTSKPDEPQISDISSYRTDFDKMLDVLNDFAYLDWAICQPDNPYYKEYADQSQTMTEEREYNGDTYKVLYHKVTGGDLQTENQFTDALDEVLTKSAKQTYLNNTDRKNRFRDGNLYLEEDRLDGRGMGFSYIELNSVEHPDENSVIMNMTAVGDKSEWGLDEDLRDATTVKFIKGDDGKFRIDEYERHIPYYFGISNEIRYGDISLSLGNFYFVPRLLPEDWPENW